VGNPEFCRSELVRETACLTRLQCCLANKLAPTDHQNDDQVQMHYANPLEFTCWPMNAFSTLDHMPGNHCIARPAFHSRKQIRKTS
jgi:hypothetical protein